MIHFKIDLHPKNYSSHQDCFQIMCLLLASSANLSQDFTKKGDAKSITFYTSFVNNGRKIPNKNNYRMVIMKFQWLLLIKKGVPCSRKLLLLNLKSQILRRRVEEVDN
jgi:hypothetical protein